MILDHNRHVVPDGTPVRFLFTTGGEQDVAQSVEYGHLEGRSACQLPDRTQRPVGYQRDQRPGVPIRPAATGYHRREIGSDHRDRANRNRRPKAPLRPPRRRLSRPLRRRQHLPRQPKPEMGDWVLALAVTLGSGALGLWLGISLSHIRWGLRWALCVVIGGLLAYNYLVLDFPGSQALIEKGVTSGTVIVTVLGVLFGALRWVGPGGGLSSAKRGKSADQSSQQAENRQPGRGDNHGLFGLALAKTFHFYE